MGGEQLAKETDGYEREAPRLAEAPPTDVAASTEADPQDLVSRLERQAEESGRLTARIQALEAALEAERDARRRVATTLRRERKAAATIHERAEHHEAAHAATAEELARLREVVADSEQQMHGTWARLSLLEQELAWKNRSPWRKLLRRPHS
jgi:hypothetical protein